RLKVFTACFYYVSHGNGLITCYEGTFRELELYNYPHWQTENLWDTKTSQELERLRSLHV
ncbi:MAG: hypothetical protein OIF50_02230, partial [Flavobacteriaceae bacterium]|nr:hypothetical protein [Flavobacteriaceae bacterium]